MIEYCGEYFKSTGVEFHGHGELPPLANRAENEDQWMFERMVMENAETYAPYEQTDNTFDMTEFEVYCAGDIPCPELDKTVIFRYIEYGNEDRWGKRKPEVDTVKVWIEDSLLNHVDSDASKSTSPDRRAGRAWFVLVVARPLWNCRLRGFTVFIRNCRIWICQCCVLPRQTSSRQ